MNKKTWQRIIVIAFLFCMVITEGLAVREQSGFLNADPLNRLDKTASELYKDDMREVLVLGTIIGCLDTFTNEEQIDIVSYAVAADSVYVTHPAANEVDIYFYGKDNIVVVMYTPSYGFALYDIRESKNAFSNAKQEMDKLVLKGKISSYHKADKELVAELLAEAADRISR